MRSSRGFQGHGGHVFSSHPGESIRKTQNAPRWRKETPRKSTCISAEHSQRRPPAKIRIFAVGNGPYGCFARSSAQARAQPTRDAVILRIFLMQDFNNLRVTDLPTNRQVGVPPLAPNHVEIQMAGIEAELVQATSDYIKSKCDQKGIPKETNLSSELQKGMKETVEMTKNGSVIVTETDKSSRLSLDTI